MAPDERVPMRRISTASACRMPLRATKNKPTVKGRRNIKINQSIRRSTAHEVNPNQKLGISMLGDPPASSVPERNKATIPPIITMVEFELDQIISEISE